jgi:predicted RNA-binding Zn-ribbon protein involved in translation (DUF1610 family)
MMQKNLLLKMKKRKTRKINMTENESVLLFTCPKCGNNDGKIRAIHNASIEDTLARYGNGKVITVGEPYIWRDSNPLYQCPACGNTEGDIRYFMPEKLEEAKKATAEWRRKHPHGCF